MTERAAVGPRDGIVAVELSLNRRDEIPDVIGCLRAGAAAWEMTPFTSAVDQASRARRCAQVVAVAEEIAAEARRVHEAREAFYRAEGKALDKAAREKARAKR